MDEIDSEISFDRKLQLFSFFFAGARFSGESLENDIQNRKIIYAPSDFVTYLQTALLDEKLVEVRFDDKQDLYFTKITDSPSRKKPPMKTPDEEVISEVKKPGRYLTDLTHITTLPFEPGMGNFYIRDSQKVVMRFFTKAFAFEFGTYFRGTSKATSVPTLDFDFPVIGRLLEGKREYRAKVTSRIDVRVIVAGKRKQPDLQAKVIDISASGMAFQLSKEEAKSFFIGEYRSFSIIYMGKNYLDVKGKVIHVTAVRKLSGVTYICGVQLDLVIRLDISKIEALVAKVQRAHLQSLSGISIDTGYRVIQ